MRSGIARILAGIGAATGAFALTLQYVSLYADMSVEGANAFDVLWYFLGYFTILTNIFVTAIFARAVLRPRRRDGFNHPRVEAAGLAAIVLVGLVYHVLLSGNWNPQGAALLADTLLHSVMPLLFLLFWLARPHGVLGLRDALFCLAWPVAYAAYSLLRGLITGWYAYYFLDASNGFGSLAMNVLSMGLCILIGAAGLVAVDRELGKLTGEAD